MRDDEAGIDAGHPSVAVHVHFVPVEAVSSRVPTAISAGVVRIAVDAAVEIGRTVRIGRVGGKDEQHSKQYVVSGSISVLHC